jgi:hypothetical protein
MDTSAPTRTDAARRAKSANLRTALVFASIAIVFFCGIIATKWMGGPVVGIGVMGVAVLVFLVFAIGRNLRK